MVVSIIISNFIISMFVSTIIIYVVTKFLGENEGLGSAVIAAFIGAVVYTLSYFLFGNGFLASSIGGITWLITLGGIYKIGWLKSLLIAFVVWIIVSLLSFLPTVVGPL